MSNVIDLLGKAVEPDSGEPCADLIAALERAVEIARSGQMLGFVMVYEKPHQCTGNLSHICGHADLKQILAALVIEQAELTRDILEDNATTTSAPEGA